MDNPKVIHDIITSSLVDLSSKIDHIRRNKLDTSFIYSLKDAVNATFIFQHVLSNIRIHGLIGERQQSEEESKKIMDRLYNDIDNLFYQATGFKPEELKDYEYLIRL